MRGSGLSDVGAYAADMDRIAEAARAESARRMVMGQYDKAASWALAAEEYASNARDARAVERDLLAAGAIV